MRDNETNEQPQINIEDFLTKENGKDTYTINIKELTNFNKFGLINSITVTEIEATGWYEVFFSIQGVSDIRLITQRNESRKYKNLTRLLNLLKTHCDTVPYINFSNKK